MQYDTITSETKDGVAVLTLNRPDKMNALNTQMRAELTDAVRRAGKEARVVVLTGAGKAFCSGQDLGDRATAESVDLERILRDEYEPMLRAIVDCPVPVISAMNGPAAGAGANLALVADVVIAAHGAYFVQAFSRIGLVPDAGGSYILPRAMGLPKAIGAALFADKVSAQDAADWGMIWEAVPDADFVQHWQGRARYLAEGPTVAFQGIKTLMRASFSNEFDAQIELEAKTQGTCGRSRDFKEGVLAFLEKRAPKFEGR